MIPEDTAWFAINARARYEEFVAKQISARGYEVFLPVYRSKRRWSDRVKEIDLPLFPGYLFCRFDPAHRLPIMTTPGVIHIVSSGRMPLPVDEKEIAALQTVDRSSVSREPWPFARIGEKVRIEHGPLCGIEGTLVDFKGTRRLVLSVTLLRRSVALEIESAWVAPAPTSPRNFSASPTL